MRRFVFGTFLFLVSLAAGFILLAGWIFFAAPRQ